MSEQARHYCRKLWQSESWRMVPSAERVRQLLKYSPETGELRWRVSRRGRGARLGRDAGAGHAKGYRRVSVDGRDYLVHRVIWLWMTGEWPAAQIDHRNGVRDDNRW